MEIVGNVYNWASILDAKTAEQAQVTSKSPVLAGHVALMPDAHLGIGATVGSVIVTKDAIIPASVGVDIGCGMIAVETDLTASQLPEKLGPVVGMFRKSIPAGAGGMHAEVSERAKQWFEAHPPSVRVVGMKAWKSDVGTNLTQAAMREFGTLGSGNHFVEVSLDERNHVWVIVHSGSRGVGNKLATFHIAIAKQVQNVNDDLAYLEAETPQFDDYVQDMLWAQDYALQNREAMMDAALADLFGFVGHGSEVRRINCHHNFAIQEQHFGQTVWVTRKGAIRAQVGDLGIIPGSMGAKSYITTGLGNPLSYFSSSHGAGRVMGRNVAKKTFTVESLEKYMEGKAWDSYNAKALLDEHPEAYKPIDVIMNDQKDLTKPIHTLRQIVNYKGL